MPKDKDVEFVAIDEIQMCADRERTHLHRKIAGVEEVNLRCF